MRWRQTNARAHRQGQARTARGCQDWRQSWPGLEGSEQSLNHEEAILLVGSTAAVYPSMSERDLVPIARAWSLVLGDMPYQLAEKACLRHVNLSKFFPTPAELREHAAALMPTSLPDAEVAWGEVLRSLQKVGSYRKPEWTHPAIEETVKHMWGSWANACATVQVDNLGVDRAQFVRMYTTVSKRQREAQVLPPMLQAQVGKLLRLPS
jgi:hypothetical protein